MAGAKNLRKMKLLTAVYLTSRSSVARTQRASSTGFLQITAVDRGQGLHPRAPAPPRVPRRQRCWPAALLDPLPLSFPVSLPLYLCLSLSLSFTVINNTVWQLGCNRHDPLTRP